MDTLGVFAHAVNSSVCTIDDMNTSYAALIASCSKCIHFHNASIDTTRLLIQLSMNGQLLLHSAT